MYYENGDVDQCLGEKEIENIVYIGKISSFLVEKGFGFIYSREKLPIIGDVFFHIRNLICSKEWLKEGSTVHFKLKKIQKIINMKHMMFPF